MRGCWRPRLRRTSAASRASSSASSKGLVRKSSAPMLSPRTRSLQRALGREDEHRRAVVGIAHRSEHREAVPVGQLQVEHHRVVFGRGHEGFGGARIGCVIGHEAALAQSTRQPGGHVEFVFHQQDAHGLNDTRCATDGELADKKGLQRPSCLRRQLSF